MEEKWKRIPGFPKYKVSNYGRILSYHYKTPRIMKPRKAVKTGYLEIGLSNNNKRKFFLVHRLVLSLFNPIEHMEEYEVNHLDENKENNRLDNLEWVTPKENCNYGTRNERIADKAKIPVICIETGIVYPSNKEAAEATGIGKDRINMCCTGYRNAKTAGGYHWRYAK